MHSQDSKARLKKKELVKLLVSRNSDLHSEDIEDIVNLVFDALTDALIKKQRIDIRGFGNFSIHKQKGREFINPKTGRPSSYPTRHRIVFKAGKKLVKILNNGPD